jgi:hypothetical protein
MSSETQENQEQQSGIPVELVIKKMGEKKVYPIRLEFIPKPGDAVDVGETPYKVDTIKYKEDNGSFIPVIELEEK